MRCAGAGRADEAARWFELDDDEDEDITETDRWFLAVLRQHAADGWRWCDPDDTHAFHDHHRLRMVLSVSDHGCATHLLTYGLAFDGDRIVGDRVHDQTWDFENATADRFEAEGSVPYLATRAERWLASILDGHIEHRRWHSFDKVIYQEWVVANTDEVIRRRGRPRTDTPDRVTLVGGTAPHA
jgi:hypothetical protein